MPNRSTREESQYRGAAAQLARALRQARKDAKLSQEAVAREAGVSVNTVRKIETLQVVEPGYFTVRAMARVLGVDLSALEDVDSDR